MHAKQALWSYNIPVGRHGRNKDILFLSSHNQLVTKSDDLIVRLVT